MSITATATPTYKAGETDEKMQKARTLYETKLKAKLEPEFNNKFIAIEPETELAMRILGAEALAKVRQK